MKRLAIFLDGSANDRDSLKSAAMISALTGAHLDVLYPWTTESLVSALPGGAAALVNDVIGEGGQNAARNAFDDICQGLPASRWVDVRGTMHDAIRAFGLLYDAIILERLSEEKGPHARAFNTALFETGTPVLVTPPTAPATVGEAVALVWTPTPQASRAMRSALPILRVARQVRLLTNSGNIHADPARALEYLRFHGVTAEHLSFDGSRLTARGRGRAIIEAARTSGADLLIMGGFGEHQFDALFGLGRTTRKLVTAAPVPLLLQA